MERARGRHIGGHVSDELVERRLGKGARVVEGAEGLCVTQRSSRTRFATQATRNVAGAHQNAWVDSAESLRARCPFLPPIRSNIVPSGTINVDVMWIVLRPFDGWTHLIAQNAEAGAPPSLQPPEFP
jgi:hypothetical protein